MVPSNAAETRGAAWTDLGRGRWVRTSALYQTTSTLLADPEHAILVDPAVLPSEIEDIAARVKALSPRGLTLVFTHPDWDHVLGRPWFPNAKVLAHDDFAAVLAATEAKVRAEAEKLAERPSERWPEPFRPFRPDLTVSGLHYRRFGPWHAVFRDAPGHHAAQLTLHLPEHRTLIAADMLSDIEIPILKQPIAVYRRTLADLAVLAQGGAIETLIPGHGTVARSAAEARARIDRDLAYLDALHAGVAEAVRAGATADEAVRRLEAMDYTGKNAEYSMVDVHQRNVRLAHDGLASSQAPTPRGAR